MTGFMPTPTGGEGPGGRPLSLDDLRRIAERARKAAEALRDDYRRLRAAGDASGITAARTRLLDAMADQETADGAVERRKMALSA